MQILPKVQNTNKAETWQIDASKESSRNLSETDGKEITTWIQEGMLLHYVFNVP